MFLIVFFSFFSCTDQKEVTVEQVKTDIIGTTIGGKYGAWYFGNPTKFVDVKINKQERTDETLMVDTEFILQGGRDGQQLFYLHATLEFILINRKWRFVEGKQIKYLKDYESRSLPG